MQVEGDRQPEAAVPGGAEADAGGDGRARCIEAPALGDGQQRRLEAGGEADGEQLLRIGPGAGPAAHLLGDREIDVQPAVGGPPVALSSAFDRRNGGVENVHSPLLLARVRGRRSASSSTRCYGTTTRGNRSIRARFNDTDPTW